MVLQVLEVAMGLVLRSRDQVHHRMRPQEDFRLQSFPQNRWSVLLRSVVLA